MYVLQNTAVALSALCALISLHSAEGSAWFWAGAICTIGIGSISSVGAQGSSLSVEKEWTVVLCKGDSAVLAKLNSGKLLPYISLVIAVVPVWLTQLGARLPASTTSHVLLGGLVVSRFGLWLFDLSVSQMLQEWVPAEDIGKLTAAVI